MKKIETLAEIEQYLDVGTKYFKYSHNGRLFTLRDLTIKKTSIGKILNAIKREKVFVTDYDHARLMQKNGQTQIT